MEIKPGIVPGSVEIRVVDSSFQSDLYWIDRSNDGGKTWSPCLWVQNGEWNYVKEGPAASFFRARITK